MSKDKLARTHYQLPFTQPELVRDAIVLEAQNAADWVLDQIKTTAVADMLDSIPVSVAPWPKTLVLYRIVDPDNGHITEVGCFVEQTQVPSEAWEQAGQERWDILKVANVGRWADGVRNRGPIGDIKGAVHPDLQGVNIVDQMNAVPCGPIAFIQEIAIFAYRPGMSSGVLWGYGALPLGPTGKIAAGKSLSFISSDSASTDMDRQLFCFTTSMICSAAMLFANTKNIKVVEGRIQRAPRIKVPSGEHLTKEGEIVYKTLEIGGITKRLNDAAESPEGQGSGARAFHICKGHFSTYGPEAPLFGKHIGTYWVPMHARGTKIAGQVEKDYAVGKISD